MKKIISILSFLALFINANSQTMQASIGPGTMLNRIKLYLKPDVTQSPSTISTLQFNVGITEASTTTPPTLTVVSHSFGSATWTVGASFKEGGYWNYNIYTSSSPLSPTLSMNTEFEAMELQFANGTPTMGTVALVTLPDGGSNTLSLFLCTGSISSNGINNLYYARSGVTVDNQNSYDPNLIQPGTSISTANIPNVVLPVKFLDFTVAKNSNSAILNWSVESEDAKTDKYEILRSANGVDFTTVATIEAKNNGLSANAYSFTQENLSNIRNNGVIYYRIKQIDKDGKAVITEIKNVRLTSKGLTIGVYPNPIKHTTNVSFDLVKDAEVILTVNDAGGKQLMINQFNGFKGSNIRSLDLSKFATGNYILKLQSSTDVNTLPIIKANN